MTIHGFTFIRHAVKYDFPIKDADVLVPFKGTHPAVMQKRSVRKTGKLFLISPGRIFLLKTPSI